MIVLITGITGYIGRQLAAYAKSLGHEVVGVVRGDAALDYECYLYDGTYDSIRYAVAESKADIVFHLATAYFKSEDDVERIVDANLKLPIYLAQALSSSSAVFVAVGSFWQFGCDKASAIPLDSYSASKAALETMLEYFAHKECLKVRIAYLYGTYGDGDGRGKFLDSLISSIKKGVPLDVSPGFQVLNLLHVDDVVRALFLASENALQKKSIAIERYCINDSEEFTLRDVVGLCATISHKHVKVTFGAVPYRDKEIMQPRYPFPSVPGWSKEIMLSEYISKRLKG